VERRFGWDCHGLPVEYEIDKKLGVHLSLPCSLAGSFTQMNIHTSHRPFSSASPCCTDLSTSEWLVGVLEGLRQSLHRTCICLRHPMHAGIKTPEDVEAMGIDKYNEECRAIVMRYSQEWRQTVTRLGRWIDFDNDYKTLHTSFMESVWWVFGQLWEKGLVYRGFKVRSQDAFPLLSLLSWTPFCFYLLERFQLCELTITTHCTTPS
jgi:leucyl-tRNA synthetase